MKPETHCCYSMEIAGVMKTGILMLKMVKNPSDPTKQPDFNRWTVGRNISISSLYHPNSPVGPSDVT